MENLLQTRVKKIETTSLSSHRLKQHIIDMLQLSTQCRAILECVNDETGEYRIVLEGIIEDKAFPAKDSPQDSNTHRI